MGSLHLGAETEYVFLMDLYNAGTTQGSLRGDGDEGNTSDQGVATGAVAAIAACADFVAAARSLVVVADAAAASGITESEGDPVFGRLDSSAAAVAATIPFDLFLTRGQHVRIKVSPGRDHGVVVLVLVGISFSRFCLLCFAFLLRR